MTWRDIEDKLVARAEEVAAHLFPAGKRDGAEWCVGSLAGEAGKSLQIRVQGDGAGLWSDFASGGKGGKTFTSLWCAAKGKEYKQGIGDEIRQWLGLPAFPEQRVKQHGLPAPDARMELERVTALRDEWAKCTGLDQAEPVARYLTQKRGLSVQALTDYRVRATVKHGQYVMVFPYYRAPGDVTEAAALLPEMHEPAWLKFELLERPEGKKREWTTKNPEKSLFGKHLAAARRYQDCRELLICEGEKDALAWAGYGAAEWGVLPVSVPFGAKWKGQDKTRPSPNREWLDRDWDWLKDFETIYIAMDADEAGTRAAADLIEELGPRWCRLVALPPKSEAEPAGKFKDANDCVMAGVPAERMRQCLAEARDFAPQKIRPAATYEEEFITAVFDEELESGLELPFNFPWRVRPGEMTVWTGREGSGKSTMLLYVLMNLLNQGERALVGSFETKVVKTLMKMARQAKGGLLWDRRQVKKFTDQGKSPADLKGFEEGARLDARHVFHWLAPRLWMYDHTGICPWRDFLEDLRWARRRYGITQAVFDNAMRAGIAKDDYAQQADMSTAFAAASMDLGVHIHIVVHRKKGNDRHGGSEKSQVEGAGEIIRNAHNIVEVERDEDKAQKVEAAREQWRTDLMSKTEFDEEMKVLGARPDGKFILRKNRDGQQQDASKYLWFLWEAQQYCDKPPTHEDYRPICFAPPRPMEATPDRQLDIDTDYIARLEADAAGER